MGNPKFSIIVPTCGRPALLANTLKSITSINRDDVEIVISDNASQDNTPEVIDRFRSDSRVVALHTGDRLAAPDHWNFMFTRSKGDYVVICCDDDGVSPQLFDRLDATITQLRPRLISWASGLYHYPDYHAENSANTIFLLGGHSDLALVLRPDRMIERFGAFHREFFPEATHFCIARELAAAVTRRTGRLFWPYFVDWAGPLLCLAECKTGDYVYIDAPLSFGGRSPNSNVAAFVRGGDDTNVKSYHSEFHGADLFPFHEPKLPFYVNGYASALTLAKHFYPLGHITLDLREFYRSMIEEVEGIKFNPLVDANTRAALERHIASCGEDEQRLALEVWSSVRNSSFPAKKSDAGRLVPFKRVVRKVVRRVVGEPAMRSSVQHIVQITAERFGINNSIDLAIKWDGLMDTIDWTTYGSIEKACDAQIFHSAHNIPNPSPKQGCATHFRDFRESR